MTADQPAKSEPKIPVPIRISPKGKAAVQKIAAAAGYDSYTAWMRDVIAAEVVNPKHNPTPKPKKK